MPTSVKNDDRKALRCGPLPWWIRVRELVQFDADKSGAQQTGGGQPCERRALTLAPHADDREAVGDRRQQQQRRVDGNQPQIEELGPRGTARVVAAQHTVAREQAREDQAIAHQIEPEPE